MPYEKPHEAIGSRLRGVATYGVLLTVGLGGFLLVRHLGVGLIAPPPSGTEIFGAAEAAKVKVDALMHVFLALAVIIVTARALGALFAYLSQPPVIGEVIAGILLGPSLLGRVAPEASAFILPPPVAPFLRRAGAGRRHPLHVPGRRSSSTLAPRASARTRRSRSRTPASSRRSCSASALALLLYPRLSSSDVPFTPSRCSWACRCR